jgi:hypothetical protein
MDARVRSRKSAQISLEGHAASCPKSMGADSADALQDCAPRRGETPAHACLKRLALTWAQAHGYSVCGLEVTLPRCRYRADLAAYRPAKHSSVEAAVLGGEKRRAGRPVAPTKKSSGSAELAPATIGSTAIFECKQALIDLRRDNGSSAATRERLEKVHSRLQILERNLRVHYPQLRIADSLFAEFDSHDFEKIKHRGYTRVSRELAALQNRLFDCTKFEKLVRYRCANLFFLVLPAELFREAEIPIGWGALIESNGALNLVRKPVWHEIATENQLRFLERIAATGTRALNRQLEITFEDILAARSWG